MQIPKTLIIGGAFTDWPRDGLGASVVAAEEAGVEALVLPDDIAPADGGPGWPDALILIAWLARRTKRIRLYGAVSSVGHQPYNLARRLASLDLISKGRAGWVVVDDEDTQSALAAFSGANRLAGVDLSARQSEFETVVQGLWQSWDAEALILDKAGGQFFEPAAMHWLDHDGPQFSVRGPLNVMRWEGGGPALLHARELGDMQAATGPDDVARLLGGRV